MIALNGLSLAIGRNLLLAYYCRILVLTVLRLALNITIPCCLKYLAQTYDHAKTLVIRFSRDHTRQQRDGNARLTKILVD